MKRGRSGICLDVQGVGKAFGSTRVLQGLQLMIPPGEFVAVVGRSGCGKSTLLRLISGLDQPSEGKILLDNQPVTGVHADVRMMFQEARLLPWQRVIDNVQIGIKSESRISAEEVLQLVGLADRAAEWPRVLSGGQRQRVALARALAGEPRLLLLDEPLGALDALTRIEMQQLIEELWLEQKFSAILVTHDVSEAVTLADRVIVLEKGRVALDLPISLPRPRARDHGFAHFERVILDKVMARGTEGVAIVKQRAYSYSV
ncbi:ATP-binding cassette domain-containing protein [Brevibacillus sp. B_LB10_24]|jgi:sulfonate transport system ATP-binding protein|uniref:ATP-binding cassette domain-containing protein n=1 Tax=Brevibacillus TaxID=55080 RepID=UPI0002EDC389|nr:ATP-binding cassette domain-containing protein [Brevibacillus massiliensis]